MTADDRDPSTGVDSDSAPRWIGADELVRRVSPARARELIRAALANGLDVTSDPPRAVATAGQGQLLMMPSIGDSTVGTKLIGLHPDNPSRGLPRIQAVYVLMDSGTMTPSTLFDGVALTNLRTPATSAVAIDLLAAEVTDSAVVVGSGPQALGHAEALLQVRSVRRITVVGRDPGRARACAAQVVVAAQRSPGSATPDVVATADREALAQAVHSAQVVMCTTSSTTPVIHGDWVADGACIVAVGTHEAGHRELDSALMGRALVIVEDVATALREAGDVVLAIEDGSLAETDLRTLQSLVVGEVRRADDRPNVFKSVGMAWQDRVVAEGALAG